MCVTLEGLGWTPKGPWKTVQLQENLDEPLLPLSVPLTCLPPTFSKAWLPRESPESCEGCRDTPTPRRLLVKTLQSPVLR